MSLKILIVGAGGLGCELLKLLVKNKNYAITIIDDDTVDATNLNRQFLFVLADVGKSKSVCAAKKLSCAENPIITAIHAKIQEYPKVQFYKEYKIVFNCLDNNETRSFVNQRCNLAGITMIDGGSAGWLGQSFYNGGECFDCLPKRSEEEIPLCSIRQSPTEFKHCIAWAISVVDNKSIGIIYEDILGIYQSEEDSFVNYEGECLIGQEEGNILLKEQTVSKEMSECTYESLKENMVDFNEHTNDHLTSTHVKKRKINYSLDDNITRLDSSEITSVEEDCMVVNDADCSTLDQFARSTPVFSRNSVTVLPSKELLDSYINKIDDKNLENRLELIYKFAVIKAKKHNIDGLSYFDSLRIINKIIPSICTTNSIVAALMILSVNNRKNYYLVQSVSRFISMEINLSRTDCLTCSIPLFFCRFSKNAKICDLLTKFRASSATSETNLYDEFSGAPMDVLDGQFVVLHRNDSLFRFYLEKIENDKDDLVLNIIRIR
ncbi:ubiquitin-like 1-activating enzyme E1 B [Pancytospora epiphaga]|nr:ubiquitin-like 1-activating enzyme E1 B [Pancytospora epiphaga]